MGGMIGPALQWAAAIDFSSGGDTTESIVNTAMGKTPDSTVINKTEKIVTQENEIEAQSAQRRLARLSRYFTSPTGVMDSMTGSQGVF